MPSHVLGDRVMVQSSTTGTGTYSLGSAVTGFLDFALAGVASGSRVPYLAIDDLAAPTTWEIVEGIYTAGAPATLTRETVRRNSSGGTTAINWGAGTRYIMLAPAAGRLLYRDSDGNLPLATTRLIELAAGVAATDAAQLNQVGWQYISQNVFSSATSGVAFTLPSQYLRFRVEFADVTPAVTGQLYARFSTDNAVTYHQAASDYQQALASQGGTGGSQESLNGGLGSYIKLTEGAPTTAGIWGHFEFQNGGSRMGHGEATYYTGANLLWRGSSVAQLLVGAATITHILIAITAGNMSSGRFRLLGGMT